MSLLSYFTEAASTRRQDHSRVTGFYWMLTVMSTLGFGDVTFESDMGRGFLMVVLVSAMVWAPTALTVSAQTSSQRVDVWAAANVVGQATGEDDIRSELTMSLDLFADVRLGPVVLHAYVEANTTPRTNGVSTRIPFSNTDAGTALGSSGKGRVQISELRVAWPFRDDGVLLAGLMDLTGFLDVSRIANDENLFFLAQPFVNNPTILFPDYTLASALFVGLPRLPGGEVVVTLASSHGVADHPEASYRRLLDHDAEGRGVFTGGRVRLEGDRWRGALGAWTSTGERVGRVGESLPTRGLFSVMRPSAM